MMCRTITKESIISRKEKLIECELNGEVIIMDSKTENFYNLNKIGSIIWYYLEKPATFDDIYIKIISNFVVNEETCKEDIIEYIKKMDSYGLLRIL